MDNAYKNEHRDKRHYNQIELAGQDKLKKPPHHGAINQTSL